MTLKGFSKDGEGIWRYLLCKAKLDDHGVNKMMVEGGNTVFLCLSQRRIKQQKKETLQLKEIAGARTNGYKLTQIK